jgi:8-oxo-dGTP pyrophosphatase MutT (NUDIX family)
MATVTDMLPNTVEIEIVSRGNRWQQSWHLPTILPEGKQHGSAGICLVASGDVVVISNDEVSWDFPAGRPEGDEDWEQTLRREVLEEACAVVTNAHLLGFARGRCVEGPEAGRTLVRSIWLARVTLNDWLPQFEIRHRKLVPFDQCISVVLPEYTRFWRRVFLDAQLAMSEGDPAAG